MDSLPFFVISAILFVGYDLATSSASGYLRFKTLFGLMAAVGLNRILCIVLLRVGADREGSEVRALASCAATSDCGDSTMVNDPDVNGTCSFSSATRATPTTASQDEARRRPDRAPQTSKPPLPISIDEYIQTNRPRFAPLNTSVAMRPYRYVPSCKSHVGPYTRPARRSLNLSLIPPRTVPARHPSLVVHIPLRATTVARVYCVSATQARAPPPPPPPRPSRPPPPPPPVLQPRAPRGPKQPRTLPRPAPLPLLLLPRPRPARTLPVIPMEVDPPSPLPRPPPPPPCDWPWPWHARAHALLSTVDRPQDYYAALERARAARPVFPWAMLVDSD
ncbi:hypothetical protein GGX14DRAFT_610083 [Mycena pura]|uniref:Uncharacterized protein n=1 Tax=Mycena pura TaxID=153505 RepID=A0AAD6YI14_9AGAR|nr:hypothetical protein GGX14DRAFT_610083 [Mycena pura]